ncbi:MAG: UPF0182 family protein [Actinomycetota bacterium]|nr:UPF0182 family protein [Actinomycetota bacterium]
MVVEAREVGRRGPRRGFVIVAVIVLIVALMSSARFYTDVLWFQELGITSVLWTSLATQFGLGAAVGLITGAFVWLNLRIAAAAAPAYRAPRGDRPLSDFDRYRDAAMPYIRWIRLGAAAFVAFSAGVGAGRAWTTFLLWSNRTQFGETDPQFNKDISFYVFELPFLSQALEWIWFALIAALFFSAIAHFVHGSIQPVFGLRGVASGAMAHLSVLLGLLALTKAAQYWLGQYELNFSPRGVVTGASYTDIHAQLPALKLLALISIVSAVLFLVNIRYRSLVLVAAAVGIWILTAFLAGGVWPWAVQRFSVDPQELVRERPYIARNLEATTTAFDLAGVEEQDFLATSTLDASEVEDNESLLANVRLWDPDILQLAYQQLQAIRTYYDFEDVDIDRYDVDGTKRQVLLSARELSLDDLPEGSRNWANVHLQYTHGFGLVASLANSRTSAGQPSFLVKDVPGAAVAGAETLEPEQPRIYYGEGFEPEEYSVVNSRQSELDFETQSGEVERSSYSGTGGVPLGGFFRRFMFALREGDPNLILSSLITDESRILIYRDVRDRLRRAAPFLSLDHDPYPAVVEGRIVWIIDAYTSTSFYPYSQRFDPSEVLGLTESGVLEGSINYVRNSVKVVIDAYDGTMELYIVDPDDPLIQTWRNVFPDLFSAGEPSDELQSHFRYPEDLFQLQSEVFLRYHMEDPADFYAQTDTWAVARNPDVEGARFDRPATVPPTYLLMQLPGETESEFVLTRPFTPRARNNMIALMVARSDPDSYGDMLTLEFPRSRQVPGPVQVDNAINQDVEISQTLTLLRQGGSRVDFGSLVVLPIDDSILYVQPIFVTAQDEDTTTTDPNAVGSGIPELKRVALALGEEVVMEETFEDALATLFDLDTTPPIAEEPTDEPTRPPPDDEVPAGDGQLAALIAEAADLYERAQLALSNGDFETYGRLIERLGRVLAQAQRLSGGGR